MQSSRKPSRDCCEKNIEGFCKDIIEDFRLDAREVNGDENDDPFGEDVGVFIRSEDGTGMMSEVGGSGQPSDEEFLRDIFGEENGDRNTGVPFLEVAGVLLSEIGIGVTSEVDMASVHPTF